MMHKLHVVRKVDHRGPAARRSSDVRPGNAIKPRVYSQKSHESTDTDPVRRSAVIARLEALLIQAHGPIAEKVILERLSIDQTAFKQLIGDLNQLYEVDSSPFRIVSLAGGFQLRTRPEFQPFLLRVVHRGSKSDFTPPMLETLAIVAYKQPITRAEIDAIRGVASADYLRILMDRRLIRTAGRHQSLGRPLLYATTKQFLIHFGLNTIHDLPQVAELKPV